MIEERARAMDGFDGLVIMLPRRRDGSVKLMVGLEEGAMEALIGDNEARGFLSVC